MQARQWSIVSGILSCLLLAIFLIVKTSSIIPVELPDQYRIDQNCASIISEIHHSQQASPQHLETILQEYSVSYLKTTSSKPTEWHLSHDYIQYRDFFTPPRTPYVILRDEVFYAHQLTESDTSRRDTRYYYLLPVSKVLNLPPGTPHLKDNTIIVKQSQYYSPKTGTISLSIYILAHFFILIFLIHFAIFLDRQIRQGLGSLVFICIGLIVRHLFQSGHLDISELHFSTDWIIWLECTLNMVYFFVFSLYFFSRTTIHPPKPKNLWKNFFFRIIGSFVLGLFYQILIKYLNQIHISLSADYSNIRESLWGMIIFMFIYGMASFSTFLFTYKYFKTLSYSKKNPWYISAHILALTLNCIIFLELDHISPLWGFILGFLLIFFLMDVFATRRSKNLTWFLAWATLYAILGSSIFVLSQYQNQWIHTADRLQRYTHLVNQKWDKTSLKYPDFRYSEKYNLLISSHSRNALNQWGDILEANPDGNFYITEKNQALQKPILDLTQLQLTHHADERNEQTIEKFKNGLKYTLSSEQWLVSSFYPTDSRTFWLDIFSVYLLFSCTSLVIILLIDTQFNFLPSDFMKMRWNSLSYKNKIHLAIQSLVILSFGFILVANIIILLKNNKVTYNSVFQANVNFIKSDPFKYQSKFFEDIAILSRFPDFMLDLAMYENGKFVQSHFIENPFPRSTLTGLDQISTPPSYLRIDIVQNAYTNKVLLAKPNTSLSYESQEAYTDSVYTMFNWFAFILLIIIGITQLLTEKITRPLLKLRKNISNLSPDQPLQPLSWGQPNDEIGGLITAYNKLIQQKENQAKSMAKSEREGAWREMAQQVAHEIKNPLTPMKLSLQYLQSRISNIETTHDAQEITHKVSNTLIEQIDNLSNIANSFSTFARMPTPVFEKCNLVDIVENVHNLYHNTTDVDLNLYLPIDDLPVLVDRNQIVQVLNNLIKNAIQAIPSSTYKGRVDLKLKSANRKAIIAISDTGTGIPSETQAKVFSPNFTTKNSGTGLGLAISYKIVEAHNGTIYFTTEEKKGTSFFIELPLVSE